MLDYKIIECMEKAEKNNSTCMSLIIKSNRLERKSDETKKEVELLKKEILDLEGKKKSYFEPLTTSVLLSYVLKFMNTCPCEVFF